MVAPSGRKTAKPLVAHSIGRLTLIGRRPGLMGCRPFRADTEGFQLADNSSPNGAAIREPGASPRAASGEPRVHGRSKPASVPVTGHVAPDAARVALGTVGAVLQEGLYRSRRSRAEAWLKRVHTLRASVAADATVV